MRFVSLVLASAAFFSWQHVSCAEPQREGTVTKAEAIRTANRFLLDEIGKAEVSIMEPYMQGSYWLFPLKFGYAGTPARPILVNRFSGLPQWAERSSPSEVNARGEP
jgi:hypothetical protein